MDQPGHLALLQHAHQLVVGVPGQEVAVQVLLHALFQALLQAQWFLSVRNSWCRRALQAVAQAGEHVPVQARPAFAQRCGRQQGEQLEVLIHRACRQRGHTPGGVGAFLHQPSIYQPAQHLAQGHAVDVEVVHGGALIDLKAPEDHGDGDGLLQLVVDALALRWNVDRGLARLQAQGLRVQRQALGLHGLPGPGDQVAASVEGAQQPFGMQQLEGLAHGNAAGAEDLGHRPLQQHQAGRHPLLDDGLAQALAYQFIAQPALGIARFAALAGLFVPRSLRGCLYGSSHSCFICVCVCVCVCRRRRGPSSGRTIRRAHGAAAWPTGAPGSCARP